ncbi:hypothetical protein PFICI_13519 [Pestalotiopsis fici W106-1]|uniref:NmrA-like domain-containing protein n=1 Tax=Pestalotiopsis fici (strain W106-1 / CGMCC3.15140) TaxID=1229662 RepID=W3WM83_PESFW|nr:uncharacterized protein PFICI_13519 [Pestalotiopsis fici W106-1]ETS75035.1 hypothetical protein PFICI_13519 [Pestalotiopsis fici W106-1]
MYNRIAVYGHRGWVSSAIVDNLAISGASVTVLYRPGSDVSGLAGATKKIELDLEDEEALVAALQDIDIVISLVGHEGVSRQHAFIKAIPKTNVKLFVPSDLAARYEEQGLRIGVNAAKEAIELAAKRASIPMTIVLPGNFAEFALGTLAMGVDYKGNRLIYTGESADKPLNLCTRHHVAAAYASIFATTPIEKLQNRVIALSELRPTGKAVALALEKRHGKAPKIVAQSLEKINDQVEEALRVGSPFALAWYCRKIWGTGQQAEMIGNDIWEVPGYSPASLEDLVVEGKLEPYRGMPPQVVEFFSKTFE